MTFNNILSEVATSEWQPKFRRTADHKIASNMINLGHEDYPLNLEIVANLLQDLSDAGISFFTWKDACYLQEDIFKEKITKVNAAREAYRNSISLDEIPEEIVTQNDFVSGLPNLHISLGKRNWNVQAGNWKCPKPYTLDNLINEIFPVRNASRYVENLFLVDCGEGYKNTFEIKEWYKIFQTIHPFNDLNGRVGGVITAVLHCVASHGFYLCPDKVSDKI